MPCPTGRSGCSLAKMMATARIRGLEERAFNAWPARQTLAIGGWLLRLSDGYTRRANSVNALAPDLPFRDVLSAAEALFDRQSRPATFRLSPLSPDDVDATLHGAGYRLIEPSLVMTAIIENTTAPESVHIAAAPDSGWSTGFAEASGLAGRDRDLHHAMVSAIALPSAFATVLENGRPVGFGLGVRERGMIGIFDVVVAPRHRARGHGRSITQALLAWGRQAGAEEAYLQVGARNGTARRLYGSLGFSAAYPYHYRQRPTG